MSKYLRTVQKIDGINQKVILQVESCTHCPLMKFHQQTCLATCRIFSNSQTNVVDDFVINYNINTGEIHDKIPIPKWCLLPDKKNQLDFEIKTYIVYNDKVLTSDAIIDPDLPVYIAGDVDGELVFNSKKEKLIDKENLNKLLPALVAASVFTPNTNLTGEEAYEQAYSDYENYSGNYNDNSSIPQFVSKHNICSLCGEEDETVNRNINHGMCDSCWEVSHKDDKRKKQAFINNFRMKRGESFKTENYNTTVLKTDNLKILITI